MCYKSFEVAAKHGGGQASMAVVKGTGDVVGRGNQCGLCDAAA